MLALPAERVLFVVGSPYDIPGAGQIGMDVWWHNRIGMPADPGAPPTRRASITRPAPGLCQRRGRVTQRAPS